MSGIVSRVDKIADLRDVSEGIDINHNDFRESTGLTEVLKLDLADGSSYGLNKRSALFPAWKSFLEWQQQENLDVYVEADESSSVVREVLPVRNREVDHINPIPVGGRLRVLFQMTPALYFLNPSHPNFLQMRNSLSQVAGTESVLSIAHNPLTLEIVDVRKPREAEGGLLPEESPFTLNDNLEASQITWEVAKNVFNFLKESDIPFSFIRDCCKARAQKMCRLMWEQYDITARKIWNYAHGFDDDNPTLCVKVPHSVDHSGKVCWIFHVAPIVRITDGPFNTAVIDPALFDKPVSIRSWLKIQNDDDADQEFSSYKNFANQPQSSHDKPDPGPVEVDKQLKEHTGERIYVRVLHETLFG